MWGGRRKARKGLVIRRELKNETDKIFSIENASYEVTTLAKGVDGREVRAARKTYHEVEHIEGTSSPRTLLTEYEWDEYGNEIKRSEWGEVVENNLRVGNDERITINTYALNTEDWILDKISSRELRDATGMMLRLERRYYDGEDFWVCPWARYQGD